MHFSQRWRTSAKIKGRRQPCLLYQQWANMKYRCTRPSHVSYARYGGRGISICREWMSYPPYRQWAIANGYRRGLTIDRINNDGNYEPANCRWASRMEQAANKGNNVFLEHKGERLHLRAWGRKLGVSYTAIYKKLCRGMSVDQTLSFYQSLKQTR
jgi:hypothetical protein